MNGDRKSEREHFLEAETRCDTYISTQRKAVWKALLDMLEFVVSFCDRHGLRYSLDSGSLLGAVRHGGFIPWDDDVDINMPRNDYDRLMELLPAELPDYYFMQTTATDPEYVIGHVKIRDSRTTGIMPAYAKQKICFNMGIFLDIFPLDGYPEDERSRHRARAEAQRVRKILEEPYWCPYARKLDYLRHAMSCVRLFFSSEKRLHKQREDAFRKHAYAEQAMCCLAPAEFGFPAHAIFPRQWFECFLIVKFEYLMVKIPSRFDEILTRLYGDWHKFVKGGSLHGELILDAEHDYKSVLRSQFGYTEKQLARC